VARARFDDSHLRPGGVIAGPNLFMVVDLWATWSPCPVRQGLQRIHQRDLNAIPAPGSSWHFAGRRTGCSSSASEVRSWTRSCAAMGSGHPSPAVVTHVQLFPAKV
jgi:hypothetical protein